MLVVFAAALLLADAPQSAADRSHAEQLAREGRTEEAVVLFGQIVEQNPDDIEAQLWIARLALRLGRTAEAEARFRSVLLTHPGDIDARIGLGTALTRNGAWDQALAVLRDAEPAAGENAELFSALARAYRRAGDERRAFDYYRRARVLSPEDPDVAAGYESVARLYGHSMTFEGFGEGGAPGAEATSGSFVMDVRVVPALHLHGTARLQERSGATDMLAGAGVLWKFARTSTAGVRGLGGANNVSLPTRDLSGEVTHYAGIFEIGGSIRQLAFAGADVLAASPTLARDAGRWRLDARYTFSHSELDDSAESSGDHSVMVRQTWRGWRRVAVNAVYAYGIESFEDLTVDRLGSLGTTTLAGGVQVSTPSLTVVTATWEHQWRSNQTTIDRFTVAIGQVIP